jgi:hypothetical protein
MSPAFAATSAVFWEMPLVYAVRFLNYSKRACCGLKTAL